MEALTLGPKDTGVQVSGGPPARSTSGRSQLAGTASAFDRSPTPQIGTQRAAPTVAPH
jgi:hypothetical protein